MDKQELKNDLTELLIKHLDESSYTRTAPLPENGNLSLDIPFIRIEPWVYGYETVTLKGAWDLCVETALAYGKTPVLAHQPSEGVWLFRVPAYFANIEMLTDQSKAHDFSSTVEMCVEAFAMFLTEYQEERISAENWMAVIGSVVGLKV